MARLPLGRRPPDAIAVTAAMALLIIVTPPSLHAGEPGLRSRKPVVTYGADETILHRGAYAYVGKAWGDKRGISKDSTGARLISFVEDFPLPPDTDRMPSAIATDSEYLCALSEAGTVACMSLIPPWDD